MTTKKWSEIRAAKGAPPLAMACRGGEDCICAAWKEAEALLSADGRVYEIRVGRFSSSEDYWADAWWVDMDPLKTVQGRGPTPAAALHALYLLIRERLPQAGA